jgi:hypothetical protein
LIGCVNRGLLTLVAHETATIADVLESQVRAVLARSHGIARRSAILVDASCHARARDTLIAHCAWCGRIRVGGGWARPEEVPEFFAGLLAERRTHGICPACFDGVQRASGDAPLPASVVVIHTAGPIAVECLVHALDTYTVRERPSFALEVTLPDGGGATLSALLSAVSACLDENGLQPVTIELADRAYVMGEGGRVHHPAA